MEGLEPVRLKKLWNSVPKTDSRGHIRDVMQAREHCSAEAAVKGKRWYAKTLLQAQVFVNSREASRWLIESSRKLIADSRQRIRLRTNNAVFGHTPRKIVN
ncbi:MAG TPA: hypothetical protein VJ731_17985 [Terriglobales bacterium]|nr:hypothetical protein [Terriglobales bacterium]